MADTSLQTVIDRTRAAAAGRHAMKEDQQDRRATRYTADHDVWTTEPA